MKRKDKIATVTNPSQGIGEHPLSLAEKLIIFNPIKHGGEVIISDQIGVEKF